MNDLITDLTQHDWYIDLIEDCKAIMTEAVFTSRWALVEGYWNLGKRIREEAEKHAFILESFADLQKDVNISASTLYRAHQLYDQYPDIQKLPEGKNITWNKLVTKYLPEKAIVEKETTKCSHAWVCTRCGLRK